jgi:hypothetical protein
MQKAKAMPGRFKGYAVVRDQYGRIKVDDWDALDPGLRDHLLQLKAMGERFAKPIPKLEND